MLEHDIHILPQENARPASASPKKRASGYRECPRALPENNRQFQSKKGERQIAGPANFRKF